MWAMPSHRLGSWVWCAFLCVLWWIVRCVIEMWLWVVYMWYGMIGVIGVWMC